MNKSAQVLLEKSSRLTAEELAESIVLPLKPSTKIDPRSTVPLNKCKAFSVSASIGSLPLAGQSALREEQDAWQRQQVKLQQVEEFQKKTQDRVRIRKIREQLEMQRGLDEIADKFNRIKEYCVDRKIGACLSAELEFADDEAETGKKENGSIDKKEKNKNKEGFI